MLSLLLRQFKRIVTLLLVGFLLATSTFADGPRDYIRYYVGEQCTEAMQVQNRQHEIIIRAGEYDGKPGKRIYLSDVDISFKDIPTDIRIHSDSHGAYIHEYDINLKEAKALVEQLKARGVNAKLQIAQCKGQDLNAAAKLANKDNPYVYVSMHHNYYDDKAQGYFSMYNPNDKNSLSIAKRLSDAIADNGLVRQRECQPNTGYIGELNGLNNTTTGVLLELGFFSNGEELKHICSHEYVNYVSVKLADELTRIFIS